MRTEALADIWKVEKVGQLVIGRVDYDRYLVLGTETDVVLRHRYGHPAGVSVLEIDNFLFGVARYESEQREAGN